MPYTSDCPPLLGCEQRGRLSRILRPDAASRHSRQDQWTSFSSGVLATRWTSLRVFGYHDSSVAIQVIAHQIQAIPLLHDSREAMGLGASFVALILPSWRHAGQAGISDRLNKPHIWPRTAFQMRFAAGKIGPVTTEVQIVSSSPYPSCADRPFLHNFGSFGLFRHAILAPSLSGQTDSADRASTVRIVCSSNTRYHWYHSTHRATAAHSDNQL
jgi:hypothetical protein